MRTLLLHKRGGYVVVLFLVLTVGGCTTIPPNAPSSSNPLFGLTDHDRAQLASLAHELDSASMSCREPVCEEIIYTRGLVALFENRERARTLFKQLTGKLPLSSIGQSSVLWLHLLDGNNDGGRNEQPSMQVLSQLVRESIQRNVNEIRAREVPVLPAASDVKPREGGALRTVQRQLKDRDRRIAELTAQLEALKTIDRETEHRTKPLRVPSQGTPLYDH